MLRFLPASDLERSKDQESISSRVRLEVNSVLLGRPLADWELAHTF
jgi:hypothetical protein